jgi:hypothetical protein
MNGVSIFIFFWNKSLLTRAGLTDRTASGDAPDIITVKPGRTALAPLAFDFGRTARSRLALEDVLFLERGETNGWYGFPGT